MFDGAFNPPPRGPTDQNTIFPDQIIVRKDGKSLPKHIASNSEDQMWIHTADDKLEVRLRKKEQFEDYYEVITEIDYEIIKTMTEASTVTKRNGTVYVIFIIQKYESTPIDKEDKDHLLLILSFYNENKKKQFIEHANVKISQCTQRMKNLLEFNYLGIEENVRKAIQFAILSDKGKRQVYTKVISSINEKVRDRRIRFTPFQKRLMLKALVSDHKKYKKILIEEKIEAYDIQKNREGHLISKGGDALEIDDIERELEGYSEKRKMDGVVVQQRPEARDRELKEAQQKQLGELPKSYPQEIYLNQIPYRNQFQIDNLLLQVEDELNKNSTKKYDIEWFNKEKQDQKMMMDIQQNQRERRQNKKFWQGRQRVPVKQYDIFSKPEILYSTDEKQKKNDSNEQDQRVSIEAVKFMYILIKLNDENRERKEQGPLACVLDSLKDVLTFYQKRFRETSSIAVMLRKANGNYMKYKKQMHR